MITPALQFTPLLIAVTSVVVGLALLTAAVGAKHLQVFKLTRMQNRAFVSEASPLLVEWDLHTLKEVAPRFPSSPVARVFAKMTSRYLAGVKSSQGMNPVDLAEGAAKLGIEQNSEELKRRLAAFRSVGVLALATGLLGAFLAVGTPAAMVAGLGGGLVLALCALFHHLISQRIASAEAALRIAAEEFLYEMACNYDHDTMKSILQGAA